MKQIPLQFQAFSGLGFLHDQGTNFLQFYSRHVPEAGLKLFLSYCANKPSVYLKSALQSQSHLAILNPESQQGGAEVMLFGPKGVPVSKQQKNNLIDEWLPDEAFKVAHQFREKNGNDLTPALINQLLGDLNKIWREREKKQITRIKQQCAEYKFIIFQQYLLAYFQSSSIFEQISMLKRQLSHRIPFDELTAKKSIGRLQSKLTQARHQLAHQTTQSTTQKPVGVELIDNTLQIITSMQQQKKELELQNEQLRVQLRESVRVKESMEYEKAKYMEGAVWMGKRITNEIERMCQQMDMLAREEVQNSTTSFGQKSQGNWIMGAIRKGSMELYEAAITMLESAILNMEDAQRRLESNPLQENIDPQVPQVKVSSKERSKIPQPLGSGVMATMSSFKSLNVASARNGGGGNRVPSPRVQDSNRAPQQSYGFALSSGRKTHESNQSLGTYGEEPYFKGTARFQQH